MILNRETFISSVFSSLFITDSANLWSPCEAPQQIVGSCNENKNAINWLGTNLSLFSLEHASSLIDQHDYTFTMGRWPDPILRRSSSRVNSIWFRSRELKSVATALKNTARINHAVGLAAQQWFVHHIECIYPQIYSKHRFNEPPRFY